MHENEIAEIIVDCAFKIHKTLGPGLLESVYQCGSGIRIEEKRIKCCNRKAIPAVYEDVRLELGFRADLLVENKVMVEI